MPPSAMSSGLPRQFLSLSSTACAPPSVRAFAPPTTTANITSNLRLPQGCKGWGREQDGDVYGRSKPHENGYYSRSTASWVSLYNSGRRGGLHGSLGLDLYEFQGK